MCDTELEVPLPFFLHATVYSIPNLIWWKPSLQYDFFSQPNNFNKNCYSIFHIHELRVCHCFYGCMHTVCWHDARADFIFESTRKSQFCLKLHMYLYMAVKIYMFIFLYLCLYMYGYVHPCFSVLLFSILYIVCSIDNKTIPKTTQTLACLIFIFSF